MRDEYGGAMSNFKKKIYRSKAYMQFVRESKCVVTGTTPCDPHHALSSYKGLKQTDLTCIPLSHLKHDELGTTGRNTFAAKNKIYYEREIIKSLMKYICKLEGNNPEEYDWGIRINQ